MSSLIASSVTAMESFSKYRWQEGILVLPRQSAAGGMLVTASTVRGEWIECTVGEELLGFCSSFVGLVDKLDGPDVECTFCLEFDGGNELRPLLEDVREGETALVLDCNLYRTRIQWWWFLVRGAGDHRSHVVLPRSFLHRRRFFYRRRRGSSGGSRVRDGNPDLTIPDHEVKGWQLGLRRRGHNLTILAPSAAVTGGRALRRPGAS